VSNEDPPGALRAHLERLLPAGALDTFAIDKPIAFWINPLRAPDPEHVRRELASLHPTRVEWIDAFTIGPEHRRALTESAAFAEGRIYVQSLASMLAPLALDPQPGEEILDLAAAPGGKTIRIAALMQNRGRIAAVEPIKARFFRMRGNLERCGASIVRTYMSDGRSIGRKTPERFDRVLLDAPCSSEARVDLRDPDTYAHWSPRKLKESSRKQRGLIESAYTCVRPGGVLVYSTCSFAPEENEGVIEHLLSRTDAYVEALALPIENVAPGRTEGADPSLALSRRIVPTREMDGFYLCRIRKPAR
jgi:tRNA (cytosine49-C5)-methyltransferase